MASCRNIFMFTNEPVYDHWGIRAQKNVTQRFHPGTECTSAKISQKVRGLPKNSSPRWPYLKARLCT